MVYKLIEIWSRFPSLIPFNNKIMGIQVFPSQAFDLSLFPWFHIKDDRIRIHIQLGLRSYRSITNTQLYQIPNNDPIQWHQRDQNSDGIYYIIIFSTKHLMYAHHLLIPLRNKENQHTDTCIHAYIFRNQAKWKYLIDTFLRCHKYCCFQSVKLLKWLCVVPVLVWTSPSELIGSWVWFPQNPENPQGSAISFPLSKRSLKVYQYRNVLHTLVFFF